MWVVANFLNAVLFGRPMTTVKLRNYQQLTPPPPKMKCCFRLDKFPVAIWSFTPPPPQTKMTRMLISIVSHNMSISVLGIVWISWVSGWSLEQIFSQNLHQAKSGIISWGGRTGGGGGRGHKQVTIQRIILMHRHYSDQISCSTHWGSATKSEKLPFWAKTLDLLFDVSPPWKWKVFIFNFDFRSVVYLPLNKKMYSCNFRFVGSAQFMTRGNVYHLVLIVQFVTYFWSHHLKSVLPHSCSYFKVNYFLKW